MSRAAATGGVLALGGSLLLLFSAFMPVRENRFGQSEALFALTENPGQVLITILVMIGINAVYFAFRSVGARRGWAMVALLLNIIIGFNLLLWIARSDADDVNDPVAASPGLGYYTMFLAAICIVVGCIVSAVAPARRQDYAARPCVTPVPPPPTRGLSEQLRELQTLLDDGLITQDEYDTRRKRILDS